MTTDNSDPRADIVAQSPAMIELLRLVARLAQTRSSVLIEGESGAGKDLIAHLLHYDGSRKTGPFIKVHCPSIPEDLLESELFGHEPGAFTDARQTKLGKIEMADGGTLYFDQVQDLSPALQAKLLRVVEERRFERLGGTRTIEVDVRFVSSCNVDLRAAVASGHFREDLYHRLRVVPLAVAPLRERREDIQPLAELFFRRELERNATPARALAPETMTVLRDYHWPGNVRELRSVVERASLVTTVEQVPVSALPAHVVECPQNLWMGRERLPSLREVEEAYVRHVLDRVGHSQTRAAAVLGISRKALWEKRRRYGMPWKRKGRTPKEGGD
ncbi:MAG: sigma-54-dependent Fis family transcriptional regulator [Vicinamibacteria bacterium]|nr:sigma-54-dependent Fis family transcriptional regulator [Vicinamibacteria bacterium]